MSQQYHTTIVRRSARIMNIVASNVAGVAQFTKKGGSYGALHIRGEDISKYPVMVTAFYGTEPPTTRSYRLAVEKAERLAQNPSHATSYESRIPGHEMYGGAIRIPPGCGIGYLSWSGFSEEEDEAFMLSVALRAGIIELPYAKMIVQHTGNRAFEIIDRNVVSTG